MQDRLSKLPYTEAEEIAWQYVLAALDLVQSRSASGRFLSYDEHTQSVSAKDKPQDNTGLWMNDSGHWCRSSQLPAVFHTAFDLYLPLIADPTGDSWCIAHLGQSIDAQIATSSGDSFYVTGEENRKHLHCLRALSDAVIVGSGTVLADNPQLTTRAVTGNNPVRVVIDSQARLREPLGLFNDGQARTVLLHQSSADVSGLASTFGPRMSNDDGTTFHQVERWVIPECDDKHGVGAIISLLADRGLRRLFVEGGGITVSRFYAANVLDRLHVAIAPLLAGQGIGALQVPGADALADARRPPFAVFRMGDDILWDFDLGAFKSSNRQKHDSTDTPQGAHARRFPVERIR